MYQIHYGFGLTKGAIATTVSHDSHNIVAVGANDDDIMVALERAKRNTWWVCCCRRWKSLRKSST